MNFFHDTIGLIHLVTAIFAVITGSMILVMKKGTQNHIRVGYAYVAFMTVMLTTAFTIYRLWGEWGLFHYAAVMSSVTLLGGIIPILTKYPKDSYMVFHFSFMYWSVLGLYSAFFAEIMTRLPLVVFEGEGPNAMFFNMVGLAFVLVMGFGGFYFYRNKDRWEKQFSNLPD